MRGVVHVCMHTSQMDEKIWSRCGNETCSSRNWQEQPFFLVTCSKQKIIICNEAVGVCWIWGSTEDQILIKKHKHFSSVISQRANEN